MININEVIETNKMIDKENLDVRTITLGISLLDCIDSDLNKLCDNVYKKITTMAKDLVATGEEIGKEFGIPIVNKRISVTPIALIGGSACKTPDDFVKIAQTLDRAAKTVGVNFIGGYTALESGVEKVLPGFSPLLSYELELSAEDLPGSRRTVVCAIPTAAAAVSSHGRVPASAQACCRRCWGISTPSPTCRAASTAGRMTLPR